MAGIRAGRGAETRVDAWSRQPVPSRSRRGVVIPQGTTELFPQILDGTSQLDLATDGGGDDDGTSVACPGRRAARLREHRTETLARLQNALDEDDVGLAHAHAHRDEVVGE
jgi:hypothetical protein